MRMRGTAKGGGYLIFILFLGGITGSFIGDLLGNSFHILSFLKNMYTIGTPKPLTLDLKLVNLVLGFNFNLNLMSILGIIVAIIIYRKF
jgi:hypothetical protein